VQLGQMAGLVIVAVITSELTNGAYFAPSLEGLR